MKPNHERQTQRAEVPVGRLSAERKLATQRGAACRAVRSGEGRLLAGPVAKNGAARWVFLAAYRQRTDVARPEFLKCERGVCRRPGKRGSYAPCVEISPPPRYIHLTFARLKRVSWEKRPARY